MFKHLAIAAASAALILTPLAASAHSPGVGEPERGGAVEACVAFNSGGRAQVIDVVDDGLGDYLVWIEDGKGGLWACNASGYGDVFANVRLDGDLLEGKGLGMIQLVADRGWQGPALVAENVCMAMSKDTPLKTVALVGDARGGYIVWLQSRDQDLFLCNSNARGEVLVFAPVDSPIDFPGVGEIMS
jgi:hypothetical protein